MRCINFFLTIVILSSCQQPGNEPNDQEEIAFSEYEIDFSAFEGPPMENPQEILSVDGAFFEIE